MTLNEIDASYREATSMFEQGEITKEEYLNFLRGFEIEKTVTMNAEDLFWDYKVDPNVFEGMMYIAIAGLGVTASEKFAKKSEAPKL